MRRFVCRSVVIAALTTLASTVLDGQAQATKAQDDVFKKGIEALDEEEWAAAVKLFQEAIRLDPTESKRKIRGRLGLGGDEYLPRVRLGQAFVGLGDCASALREWAESDRQGIVKQSEDAEEIIEEGSEECEEKGYLTLAAFAAQDQKASAILNDAIELEKDLATLRSVSPELNAPEPRTLYERGRTELTSARTKLDAARRTRLAQAMSDAVSAAENAKSALTTARRVAERAIENGTKVRTGTDDVEALIERAGRTAQAVAAVVASSPVALTLPADLVQAQQRAQASLDGARGKVAQAKQSGADGDLVEARQMAARAQTGFVQLQTDVEQLRKSEIEREWQRLRGSAEQAFAAADARVSSVQAMAKSRAAATSDKVTAQLTSVRGSLAKGRKQFEQASAAGDLNAARTAAHTVTDVNEALDLITPAISGASVTTPPVSATLTIPDALKTAAEAFFAGRYEDVAKLLGGDVLDTMPTSLRVHAYTIRSASLFARYEYSNRQELSLQQAARADADASRRLDPAFRPNPAAFAPKFLAFYSETASASR